jgi:uncharacterized protein YjbI with pentapeptide repeats
VVVIAKQMNLTWAEWTGFGADVEETRIQEVQPNGTVTKTTIAKKLQSSKTLWDWLSLLGVPLSLAALGFWLQQLQQKQASEEAKEEILQAYFDRISMLLIDKNLIAIAVKVYASEPQEEATGSSSSLINVTEEEKELVNASVDVIRARTSSMLRRLGKDRERKGDVIRFLAETEIVSKLKLDLRAVQLGGVNLSGAILSNAILSHADLEGAILSHADLSHADLRDANLSKANITKADISNANLSNANLSYADLSKADLSNANLSYADLSKADIIKADLSNTNLFKANLSYANLTHANLWHANLNNANLTHANLSGAYLTGADLSGADLKDADLRDAAYNDRTKLPDGIDPKARGMVKIGLDLPF